MPAAAVIPAPIAYIKVAAVEKLVVDFCQGRPSRLVGVWFGRGVLVTCSIMCSSSTLDDRPSFTLRKLECFKQAFALNNLAWNNNLGLRFYFVGF